MKIPLLVTFVGLAIGFVSPTFAQQEDKVDPQIAVQIRALASKYDAAFNRNDAAAVAALYTEDVVFKTPNGTFNGRQAIEEHFAKYGGTGLGLAIAKHLVAIMETELVPELLPDKSRSGLYQLRSHCHQLPHRGK